VREEKRGRKGEGRRERERESTRERERARERERERPSIGITLELWATMSTSTTTLPGATLVISNDVRGRPQASARLLVRVKSNSCRAVLSPHPKTI